jgi:hypothetical protein
MKIKAILFKLFVFVLGCFPCSNIHAQAFLIDTIQFHGNQGNFINMVFLGDGFPALAMANYKTNVTNLSNYLFNTSPFSEYRNHFNVFAIRVPSTDAGANHPATAGDEASSGGQPALTVNTYFNSTFDLYGIHRLLYAQNSSAIYTTLFNNFPLYDQPLVIVNTPYYGGSGGSYATSSLHTSAYEILVHEIGHSFAALADEYYAGDQYFAEKPNMTQQNNPAFVKWKNWLGTGNIGIYNYGNSGNAALWFKPHQNCKMQFLGPAFCAVCKETIIEKIHQLFGNVILQFQPANNVPVNFCNSPLKFVLTLAKPNPNTLKTSWTLNNITIGSQVDSISISAGQLNQGNNILNVTVLDSTTQSRSDTHAGNHTYSLTWTITRNDYTPSIVLNGDTSLCAGQTLTLTASAANSYNWSNGATTQSITISEAGNYSVTTTDIGGCTGTSLPIIVTTWPKPAIGADTSIILLCNTDQINLTTLYNTNNLSSSWNTATPTQAGIGRYQLIASNNAGCSDTALITVKQQVARWTGTISSNWHDAGNWSSNTVPDAKTHVIIRTLTPFACIISAQDATVASIKVISPGSYQIINNKKLILTAQCSTLPDQ